MKCCVATIQNKDMGGNEKIFEKTEKWSRRVSAKKQQTNISPTRAGTFVHKFPPVFLASKHTAGAPRQPDSAVGTAILRKT